MWQYGQILQNFDKHDRVFIQTSVENRKQNPHEYNANKPNKTSHLINYNQLNIALAEYA